MIFTGPLNKLVFDEKKESKREYFFDFFKPKTLLPGNLYIGNFVIKYGHSVYLLAGFTLLFCIFIIPLCKSKLEGKMIAEAKLTKRQYD